MRFTAETGGCLKCKLSSRLIRVDVNTDVPRTDDFLKTKISWMHKPINCTKPIVVFDVLVAVASWDRKGRSPQNTQVKTLSRSSHTNVLPSSS